MNFLAGLSIALVLSVFCPPNIQAFQDCYSLTVSPSARINGMGQAGVALVSQESFWYNPASLGFLAATHRFTSSFFPLRAQFMNLQFISATGSLIRQQGYWHSPASVGVAVYRTDLEKPGCCAAGHNTKVDAISLGVAHSGDFSFGAGVAYKSVKIRSPWNDWFDPTVLVSGDAVDLGLMVGLMLWSPQESESAYYTGLSMPFRLGISWNNLGGDLLRRQGDEEVDYGPMPKITRTGMSLGLIHTSRGFEDVSVLLAFEYEEVFAYDRSPHTMLHGGVELAFLQLVTLRVGNVNEEGHAGRSTFGCTLSTRGLASRTGADSEDGSGGRGLGWLLGKLAVEFSMAQSSQKGYDRTFLSNYHSVEVQWLF